MKKDHRTCAVTWYSYDGNGTLAAIFEQQGTGAIQLKEQPVYGSDRLGTFYRLGSNYQYTITDHIGNTRVVINRNKTARGAADIVYYADYYPFGMELRSGGIENRYGYQGLYAEKDKEIGWNNLELRNYDAAVGRWLTTDPYGQYDSPYVGMGNNPITGVDKDGGAVEPPDIIYKNSYTNKEVARIKLPGEDVTIFTEAFRPQDIFTASPGPVLSAELNLSAAESYRRANLYQLRQNLSNVNYNDISNPTTSFAIVANVGEVAAGELMTYKVGQLFSKINEIRSFSLNNGYGIFGREGKMIGNYKLEMMYANPSAGRGAGTIFSLKQDVKGGALWRWDYGKLHSTGEMGYHSTIRYYWKGVKYGNTAQRTAWPSSLKAPFYKEIPKMK